MTLSFLINAVEYAQYVRYETLAVSEALQANGQTMNVVIDMDNGEAAAPLAGQHVKLLINGTVEFAGRVISVEDTQPLNSDHSAFLLNCVDHTSDFDSHAIQQEFPAGNAGDLVRYLTGLVGRGFTSNNVVDGPSIALYRADLVTPSSIMSQTAESIEHQWYIDYNRDVNFFFILDRPAPVAVINIDTDTNTYFDLDIDEDASQVKNVLYLSGAKVKSGTPDSVAATGDGDQKFWALGYEPWDMEGTTVSVNGVPKEILLDGVDGNAGDGQGTSGQCYLCLDNHGVRFPDNFAPAVGLPVDISYDYAYEPIIKVEDPASIEFMRLRENTADAPSDGVHEFRFEIPDLRVDSEDAIWEYGNLLLTRYAYPVYALNFHSWVQGWKAGQNFVATSAADKRNFSRTCYVTRVQKTILYHNATGTKLKYQISASSSPFPQ